MEKYKEQIQNIYKSIEENLPHLKDIRTRLYENPEIGGQEEFAYTLLTKDLKDHGFEIEEHYCDMETAFKATYDSKKPGASIGVFAEFDALPEIGHGCGHNLICTMALGAAYALKDMAGLYGGKIIVYGTPGEENIQSKTIMAAKNKINDIDVALMCHPNATSCTSGTSRAIEALQIEFFGKTAHAGACPEKGINALDSAVLCYSQIKEKTKDKPNVNVHGYIENGGEKASIIPDYTSLKYLTRADDMKTLKALREMVEDCAKEAALSIGCTYKVSNFEQTNAAMNTNRTMADIFDYYLQEAGETYIDKNTIHNGSTDMADISVIMPAIHPYVGLGNPDLFLHTREVARTTITEAGDKALERGAKALACTGMRIMAEPELLKKIKEEFKKYKEENA